MYEPPAPAPRPSSERRSRRSAWIAVFLVLLAAGLALLATGVLDPNPDPTQDDARTADPADASRLRSTTAARKRIPLDALEVVVVERGAGPVEGVDLRLTSTLALSSDEGGAIARTDADGRARLEGELPGFLEVTSDAWAADPPVRAVEGGREVIVEVVARPPFRTVILEAGTGIGVTEWRLGTMGARGNGIAATTDGRGTALWPPSRRRPAIVAATDGKRRVHAFLLEVPAARTEAVLEVPSVERTSRVRVRDATGAPVPGARVSVGADGTGVSFEADGNGDVELEHGGRVGLPLTVTAPGFVSRVVRLEGDLGLDVVLVPAARWTFRVRRTDGGEVPDGVRLRVLTRGPMSYGPEGPGLDLSATVTEGIARIDGLPSTAFEARAAATGPGLHSIVRVVSTDDPSMPIDVIVAPPRAFTVRLDPPAGDGDAAVVGLLWVRTRGGSACAPMPADGWQALDEAVRAGASDDPFGALALRVGSEWTVEVPACDEPRLIEVGAPDGTYACLLVAPGDPSGTREVRLVRVRVDVAWTVSPVRVEWASGGVAELVPLEVRRDENGAPASAAMTDSSGLALLRVPPGRYVLAAELPDGTRYVGDGPLLLPSQGTPVIRLGPLGR